MTTYTTFVGGLQDMSVTGVKRVYDGPPRSIAASELPAMWVTLPEGGDMPITFDGGGGWPELTAEVIVAVEPIELGTQPENYDATTTAMDNLQTAICALPTGGATGAVSKSKLTWTIRSDYRLVGQTTYWSVIARITGHG